MMLRSNDPSLVFLTGDLGYQALEPLRAVLGERFINAGVAEQNMVSVAAGLARSGLRPWVYSIAPFLYARAFEQIRNDAALHHLPVRLVGNGGGYGYGVMGPTHHALEDYGILSALETMLCLVPAFDSDVEDVLLMAEDHEGPAWIRLGRGELPAGAEAPPTFTPWRCHRVGVGTVVISVGPIAGTVLATLADTAASLWTLGVFPVPTPPNVLLSAINGRRLVIVEEHRPANGAGPQIAHQLALLGVHPTEFVHLHAGATSRGYGSQTWLRSQVGLDGPSIRAAVLG
jgi:transketolase